MSKKPVDIVSTMDDIHRTSKQMDAGIKQLSSRSSNVPPYALTALNNVLKFFSLKAASTEKSAAASNSMRFHLAEGRNAEGRKNTIENNETVEKNDTQHNNPRPGGG
ncbi:MAG: hypothetical protein Q8R83_00360 [Legionellaceae bacterium]|nr:hypothetical protein [Legionellaceae bacterium]